MPNNSLPIMGIFLPKSLARVYTMAIAIGIPIYTPIKYTISIYFIIGGF